MAATDASSGGRCVVVSGVHKTFNEDSAPVRALRGADLCVDNGEFVAVVGASGSGKSTLLNLIAGLDAPSEGNIEVAGRALTGLGDDELADVRCRHIGFVFQFFSLIDSLSTAENVALPALTAGVGRRAADLRARELLDLLGLGDRVDQSPALLSGGERQRAAIARALANEPTIVLADEPTGALDSDGAAEVVELFRRLNRGGQAIVLVTHDPSVASAASRTVAIADGVTVDGRIDRAGVR
jgi:putative ABC transport system ATP-binding protein